MTAHSAIKRAQAAATAPVYLEPGASSGRLAYDPDKHLKAWLPVVGPHLKVLRKTYANNKTGVVGVGYGRKGHGFCFIVNLGRRSKFFNINRLGRSEAFRLAVKCRAEWEQRINEINAAILKARQHEVTK